MNHTNEIEARVLPSFIEPSAPLITNPWMRPRPTHGRNLLDLFEKDSSCESVNNMSLFKVYLRLKPVDEDISDIYKVTSETSLLTVTSDNVKRSKVNKMYNFSQIFRPECMQREIFEIVVRDNMLDWSENKSFTLLTYGSSGSGKTYTLMGTEEQPGLIPRTLEYMFQSLNPLRHPNYKTKDGSNVEKISIAQKMEDMKFSKSITHKLLQGMKTYRRMSARLSSDFQNESYLPNTERHSVWVSFCEIYNERISDLLITRDKTKTTANTLKLCEDAKGHCYVKGLSQVYVRSSTEAYNVMLHGQRNLKYAETGIHSHSSRSHCLFTITLITHKNGRHIISLLRLCDLAGSERAQQTGNTGERMKESRSINSSLAVLERCLVMLKNKQNTSMSTTSSDNTNAGGAGAKTFVMPVRESKLTRLLGSSLTGGGSVTMLVAVNPERTYFQESQHVLKLSAIARKLWSEPCVELSSYQDSTTDSFAHMQKDSEIERLKFELSRVTKDLADSMEREVNMRVEFSVNMKDIVKEAQAVTAWKYEQRLLQLKEKYEDEVEEKDEIIKNLTNSEAMIKNDNEELENTLEIREREIENWKSAYAALESTHEELRSNYDAILTKVNSKADVPDRESVMIVENPQEHNVVWVTDSEKESEDSGSEEETEYEENDDNTVDRNTVESGYNQQYILNISHSRHVTTKCSDLFEDSLIQEKQLPMQNSPAKIEEHLEAPTHSDVDAKNDAEAVTENKEPDKSEIYEHDTEFDQNESDQDGMPNDISDNSMCEQLKLDVSVENINLQTVENELDNIHTNNYKVKGEIINDVIEKEDKSSEQVNVNGNLEIETTMENKDFNKEDALLSAEDNKNEIVGNDVVENGEKYENESKHCSDERSIVLTDIDTNVDVRNNLDNNQPVTIENLKGLEVNNEENMVPIKIPNCKAAVILGPETSSKKGRRRLWTPRVEEVENTDNEDESPSGKLVSKPKVPMIYGSRTRRRKNRA